MKKLIYLGIATFLLGMTTVHAEQLAVWNFNDISSADAHWDNTGSTNAPTKSSDVATAVVTVLQTADASKSANALKIIDVDSADLAAAIVDEAGFQIELTPVVGKLITITQMVVTLDATSSTGPERASILIDADHNGFDTGDELIEVGAKDLIQHSQDITQINGSTSAVIRIYGFKASGVYDGIYIGSAFSTGETADDLIIYGTISSATGPADISYVASTNTIKPGDTQNIDLVVQNNGFSASNVYVTLTNLSPYFTVNSGPAGPLTVGGGSRVTNTFSVTAATNAPIQLFGSAFQIDMEGRGSDGSTNSASANVAIKTVSSVFTSMDSSDFAAGLNQAATNTLTVSNTASFALSYTVSKSAAWLTVPSGTLSLGAGTTTNIAIVADATGLSQGQYTGTLTVNYLNNSSIPNPTNFAIQFDVGPKITPLVAARTVVSAGGVNNFTNYYEPGENLDITIPSTNDGAITVNNITNTLTLPSGWTSPGPTVYPSMAVGDSTSTTYTVTIPLGTADGTYTCTVANAASGSSWSGNFTLDVYNQAVPGISTNHLIINVPAGGSSSEILMLTNAGNASVTFNLSGTAPGTVSYLVQTQSHILATFPAVYDEPDTNTTFTTWNGALSPELPIGFDFPFYTTNFTTFTVNRYGQLRFKQNNYDESVFPYWGNVMAPSNSVRYKRESDHLIVAWYNGDSNTNEFQAWLYDDGRIQYVYGGSLSDQRAIGTSSNAVRYDLDYTPNAGEGLLLTPVREAWVTYTPSNGTVTGLSGQSVVFSADGAADQTAGTNSFDVLIDWGDGSSETVTVDVIVDSANPGLSAIPNPLKFSGEAGRITKTSLVLTNTGDVSVNYTITDASAQSAGYNWTNTTFEWDGTLSDFYSGGFSPSDTDEGYSSLIPIGFGFPFYGTVYTQMSIGVNGAISLGSTSLMTRYFTYSDGATWNTQWFSETNTLSTASPAPTGRPGQSPSVIGVPERMIAPYWDNLLFDSDASITYSGTESRMTVTWTGMYQSGGGDQTFQVTLYANGNIRFQYDSMSGADLWPNAEIGLRDSGGTRYENASLAYGGSAEDSGTATYTTNYITVTNWQYDEPVITTNRVEIITEYDEIIGSQALLFTPANGSIVISADPTSGTVPVNGSAEVMITGDARALSVGGGLSVSKSTTFDINHAGGTETVPVQFTATNSVNTTWPAIATDSDFDGVSDADEWSAGTDAQDATSTFSLVMQNKDGSRTLSWPKPDDRISRTYTIWYTSSLTEDWIPLHTATNITEFTDTEHNHLPAVYYKVTVE